MPPLSLLIKPASGSCNLRCKYCFYADEVSHREKPSIKHMTLDTVQIMVDKALSYADGDCTFIFQGGEPTLAGLPFFRAFSDYVCQHPNPKRVRIHYAIQTNGYALDESWVKWFAEVDVLVGVSLDGPKNIHDRYRVAANGEGTYNRVISFIRLLEKYHVKYNILTVVTAASARRAQHLYAFFNKNGFRYQQYIECLDPIGEAQGKHEYSLTPDYYASFLKQLFDAWYLDMRAGRYVYNRYFENLMLIMAGHTAENCGMQGRCSSQWVVEADGSVYPCDFYALDQWYLGSIRNDSFESMEVTRHALGFIEWSAQVPEECRSCQWFSLCRGGCRRNREPVTSNSTGSNYFCSAYREFFEYAYPRLEELFFLLYRH